MLRPIVVLMLFALGACSKPPSAKQHRATLFFDRQRELRMDYSGTGHRLSSSQNGDQVTFKAIHLKEGSFEIPRDSTDADASFEGRITTSGSEDRDVVVDLSIKTQVPFEIRLMGIRRKGETGTGDQIEKRFPAGEHRLRVDGVIENYYERK